MPENANSVLSISNAPGSAGRRLALPEERLADCLLLEEMRGKRWRSRKVAFRYEGRSFRSLQELTDYLAARARVTSMTIWRWFRRYDAAVRAGQDPLTALRDRTRRDAHLSRFFTEHLAAADFVRRRSVEKGTTARSIYAGLCRAFASLEGKAAPPSYATVTSFLKFLYRGRLAARRAARRKESPRG